MKRILLVDDDPDILTLERKILEREGYEIHTAIDGSLALKMLAEQEFDLILLDIMMPDVDCFEGGRSIKNRNAKKSVPVVFVTARDDADAMREGFRSGGTVFLYKPFTANKLTRLGKAMIGS